MQTTTTTKTITQCSCLWFLLEQQNIKPPSHHELEQLLSTIQTQDYTIDRISLEPIDKKENYNSY